MALKTFLNQSHLFYSCVVIDHLPPGYVYVPSTTNYNTVKIFQTDLAKGKIEYTVAGFGPAILIVHGGHVRCNETIFQKGLEGEQLSFITPSRPGYGLTPLTEENKTPKGTAELFIALLDKLAIPTATVIGISAGGLTAIEIASNYPDRVNKLVLMSALTKKWFNRTDAVYRGGKILFSPRVERMTWSLYKLSFNLAPHTMGRKMFTSLSDFRPIEFTGDELEEIRQLTFRMGSGEGFNNDLDQTIDQAVLHKIKCPTLILHSNYDHAVDISHADNAYKRIAHSERITFNNRWGHMLWIGKEYQSVLMELRKYLS